MNTNNTPITNNNIALLQLIYVKYDPKDLDYTTGNNLFDRPVIIQDHCYPTR